MELLTRLVLFNSSSLPSLDFIFTGIIEFLPVLHLLLNPSDSEEENDDPTHAPRVHALTDASPLARRDDPPPWRC